MWDDFVTEETAADMVRSSGVDPNRPEDLVSLLTSGQDTGVLSAALGFLIRSPSPLALEFAQSLLFHENSTVRRQSLYLLAALMGRDGLPWYVKCCKARECRGTTDYDARELVLEYGDESVVPLIAGLLAKQIGKGKSVAVDSDGQSARTRALEFLARFPGNKHTQEVFVKALEHWASFESEEAAWLSDRISVFHRPGCDKPPLQVLAPASHPVFAACENGDIATVREYLDQGGSVYSCPDLGRHPLAPSTRNMGRSLAMRAVQANRLDVLQLLIERGCDIDRPPMAFGECLIDLAWSAGHRKIVDFLLDTGANFQLATPKRPTFFRIVAEQGADVPLVEKMIRLGAKVDEPSKDKSTPLMKAAEMGNIPLMSALQVGGANLESKNIDNETALIYAIRGNHLHTALWLLDHGANLEAKGYRKRTPIMYAFDTKSLEMIELLLARGASLEAKDNLNRTVITLARDFYGGDVWELVRDSVPQGER